MPWNLYCHPSVSGSFLQTKIIRRLTKCDDCCVKSSMKPRDRSLNSMAKNIYI